MQTKPAKFPLGQCQATMGALGALEDNQTFPIVYLHRHASGDWGDLPDEDRRANDAALEFGDRILSRYDLPDGQKIYIITEWDRTATTILLRSEY